MYMPGKLSIFTADCIVYMSYKQNEKLSFPYCNNYASVYKDIMFPVFYLKYDILAE